MDNKNIFQQIAEQNGKIFMESLENGFKMLSDVFYQSSLATQSLFKEHLKAFHIHPKDERIAQSEHNNKPIDRHEQNR